MIVTIPVKEDKTVKLLVANTSLAVAATANSLTLGQVKDVDISQAEAGDVFCAGRICDPAIHPGISYEKWPLGVW
jgi:hypothetical protein